MGTETLSRWGHRLLTADDGSRRTFTGSVDGAPRWVAGLAAGLQAALLSLAVVVVPTVAAYVATSADPSNQDVGWLHAVGVGAGVWLLGHGAPLDVGGVRVSLIPLGVTALALFSLYASARRSGRATGGGYAAGLAAYVLVALAVALMSGHSDVLRAVLGSACVAAVGLGAGLAAQRGAPSLRDLSVPVWRRLPAPARVGGVAGVMMVAGLVVVASGLVVGWLLGGRASIADVATSLGVDVVGGTVLTLVQLALVPDLVVWALAYVAGPGFSVGAGTHLTASQVVSGPLPALPLLGALPGPDSTNAWTAWWPLVTVLVGAGAGWWLHTRLRAGQWWHPLVACLTAALVAGATAGTLVALGSGSVGPGRMAQVGGSGLLVGTAVALGTLVGAGLVALPFNPEVRSEAARRWQRARSGDEAGTDVPLAGAAEPAGGGQPSTGRSEPEPLPGGEVPGAEVRGGEARGGEVRGGEVRGGGAPTGTAEATRAGTEPVPVVRTGAGSSVNTSAGDGSAGDGSSADG